MVQNLAAVCRDGANANDCRRDQDSVPARRRSVRIQSECKANADAFVLMGSILYTSHL